MADQRIQGLSDGALQLNAPIKGLMVPTAEFEISAEDLKLQLSSPVEVRP